MGLGVPAHAQRTDSKLAPPITAFERYLVNAATPDQVPLFVSQHVSDGLIASKGVETVVAYFTQTHYELKGATLGDPSST